MINVTYLLADGTRIDAKLEPDMSVMDGARNVGVAGIDAECGGACACATCHVKVSADWTDIVGPPGELEADMLDAAVGVDARSRLSCQITAAPELDGLVVEVPATQR